MAVKEVPPSIIRVGVDIGKKVDSTAIAVTEEQRRIDADHYVNRRIIRLPLETSYRDIAGRVVSVVRALEDRARPYDEDDGPTFQVETWVDCTGIGDSVVELIREQGVYAKAVTLTGTDTISDEVSGAISMGKAWLVSRLDILLDTGRLHIPISEEAAVLFQELQNYHRSINQRGHASFNAKEGHDDTVIALGLSVGRARRRDTSWNSSWLPELDEDDWRHPDHGRWAMEQASQGKR